MVAVVARNLRRRANNEQTKEPSAKKGNAREVAGHLFSPRAQRARRVAVAEEVGAIKSEARVAIRVARRASFLGPGFLLSALCARDGGDDGPNSFVPGRAVN